MGKSQNVEYKKTENGRSKLLKIWDSRVLSNFYFRILASVWGHFKGALQNSDVKIFKTVLRSQLSNFNQTV